MEKTLRRVFRRSSYYVRLMTIFRHIATSMPCIMLLFGLLVREGILNNAYYVNDLVFGLIVGTYAATSCMYFILLWKYGTKRMHMALFIITFHLLTAAFILFVSGFLSTFSAVWIVLMICAEMFYKRLGFVLSTVGFVLTAILCYLIKPDIPLGYILEAQQGIFMVGLIGYVITSIRSVSEQERQSLTKTRRQEDFQRERLLTLVNSMGDAVVTTDEQGIIKVYNAALLSLLDTNTNISGKYIDKVLNLHDTSGKQTLIIDDAKAIRKIFSRTDLVHKFGEEDKIRLYINVAPIKPDFQSHSERGFIFIMRDITKEKTLEEERDEFVSVVSHELRTPVTIAEGNLSNLEIMQKRNSSPEMIQKAIFDAHEQIVYLSKMINDLSTLSRAERGINTGGTEDIDTKFMLQSLYHTYLPEATKKHLALNLDVAINLSHIRTSKLYLEEILQNFVTNAIKYTKSGEVTIIGHETDDGVYIAVRDTGIGISKTDQHRVFEKFYRSEDYRTRESSGTGLGLYISRKLANKLNLRINFESRLNHGSTFSIIFKSAINPKKSDHHDITPPKT